MTQDDAVHSLFTLHTVPVLRYCFAVEFGDQPALSLGEMWDLWVLNCDGGADRLTKTVLDMGALIETKELDRAHAQLQAMEASDDHYIHCDEA